MSGQPTGQGSASVTARRAGRFGPIAALGGLLAVLVPLVAGLAFVYREQPPFDLDVGSKDAAPFLDGFYAPEKTPDGSQTFRWSRGQASVSVPGFAQRAAVATLWLSGAGRLAEPLPVVTVLAGGEPVATLPLTTAVQPYQVAVPADRIGDDGLVLTLRTTEFRPPADNRRLGVLVDAVRVESAAAGGGPLPWNLIVQSAVLVSLAGFVAWLLLARWWVVPLVGGLVAVACVAAIAVDRYTNALWLREGLPLVVWSAGLPLVAWAGHRLWRRWRPAATTPFDGLGWLVLWAVLLANLLAVAHPQFLSSDLTMNVHKLEETSQGKWVQTMALPGKSAIPAPYPPAFYALLLPIYPLVKQDFGALQALITHASAVLITVLAWVALRIGRRLAGPAAGRWGALLHGFAPAGFLLVSQGNFANVFGQAAAGLTLAALALLPDWRRPWPVLAIVTALLAAMLGHFGVFLSLLVAMPMVVLTTATLPVPGRRQAATLIVLFAVALILAVAVYYRHHLQLALDVATRLGADKAVADGADLGWQAGLGTEWRRLTQSLGWLGPVLALAGLGGLWRGNQAGRVVLGWLAAGLLFGVVGAVVGLSVRYQFFALIGVAVAGGWALAWLGRRGWWGLFIAAGVAAAWVWLGLGFWAERVLTYLH